MTNFPTFARRAAVLLASTCLTPIVLAVGGPAAWADGGAGGASGGSASGGAGGTGFAGAPGGAGGSSGPAAGGGGGGAAGGGGGGDGGNGGVGSPAGGPGGTSGAINGGNGGNSLGGQGGGGGGGFNGNGAGAATIANVSALTGGAGGSGGNGGGGAPGGGGGGGGGGYGAIVTGGGASSNTSSITAGSGGAGGLATGSADVAGGGGGGGIGVLFTAAGVTFDNSGTVTGGNGGAGGASTFSSTAGAAGSGGAGVVGAGLTIINSGAITGGSAGGGGAQANAITFTGGANTLTLQAGSTINGNIDVTGSLDLSQSTPATLSNVITGSGSVGTSGGGTLTLTNTNTYTGATTIDSASTLRLSGAGSIAASSGVTLNVSSTFDISAGTGGKTIQGLSGVGATAVVLGNNTLTVGSASSTSFAGVIDGSGGTGGLVKVGTGTLTLTGANTYTGGTTVSGGTLEGTTTSLRGTITNNAAVTFDQAVNGAYAGSMSGSGSVLVSGGGVVTFSGTNSYQGGTTIFNGTLQVGQDSNLGDALGGLAISNGALQSTGTFSSGRGVVLTNTALITPASGTNLTLTGTVSGSSGRLIKTGDGTLTLGGTNTYEGGTSIVAGTIAVTNDSALGTGALELNGGALRGAANLTLTNDIVLNAASTVSAATGTTLNLTPTTSFTSSLGTSLTVGSSTDTGIVVLSVPAFITGPASLTVAGGTLRAGNADFGGSPFMTTINAGAILDLAGFGLTTVNLQGAGTVATGSTSSRALAVNGGDFSGSITGAGELLKQSGDTLVLSGIHSYTGGTTVDEGVLSLGATGGASATIVGTIQVNAGLGSVLNVINADTSGITSITNGATVNFFDNSTAGSADITTNTGAVTRFFGLSTGGNAQFITDAGGTVDFSGTSGPGGLNQLSAGSIAGGGTYFLGGNQLTVGSNNLSTIVSGTIEDGGSGGGSGASLVKTGSGTLTLTGTNTYTGGTTITGGLINFATADNLGTGGITLNGGGLQWASGNTTDISSRLAALGAGGGTVDTNGNNVTLAGDIGGAGGLTKAGAGTLILSGTNNYAGGTTVSGGILQGNTTSLQGNILNNAGVTFDQGTAGTYGGAMSGTGSLTKVGVGTLILSGNNTYSGGTTVSGGILQGNTSSLQGNILNNASVVFNQASNGTYAGAMSGTGGMTLQGGAILALTGNSSYTGATTVNASTLVVNGSLASIVTLNSGSMLGGSGTIGGLVSNGATLAPGNSIGTLNISGNFSQTGGTYVVEANAQGQSDRINTGGTATINGASVQVIAAPGNYGTSTTYTIVNATGGVSGTYSGVTSNFAFLTPSLSYNANNVFLTLALQGNAFSGFGGNTVNQRAVGSALDQSFANATGDFTTVIGALAGLNTQQGPYALNQISGQPYADFGTFNVANNALFMNALGQQMALARGGAGSGQRQALAETCDVAACDGASPFSVWGSVLGGVGSVQGDGNSSAFTYNVGGGAAGIDYRLSPSFLVGLGAGYTNGTQWVDSFQGKGWSNSVSVAAYASFTQWGLYLDALAGYAYSNNQLQRQITVPGLQPRTANGSTGANQFLAQAEAGYKIGVYAPAMATLTPFARFQTSSINQAAFNEWGANSLSLNVQQQTTTSVRTVLGAELAGAIGLGDTRTLDIGLRLGWLHEYANTARPITAAFAGAPSANFTVYGATPQRDAAVIGFQTSTNIAAATQLYLRYDGDIGSGTDNHALNVGVRVSW